MNRFQKITAAVFLMAAPASLFPGDFRTGFSAGNLSFGKDSLSDSSSFQWGAYSEFSYNVEDRLNLSGSVVKDDLSGNRLDTALSFETAYAGISLGPSFASFNNSQSEMKPGINGSVYIRKQGLISFSADMYTTLGKLADPSYDYSQSRTGIELSVKIPGALTTFSIVNSRYSRFSGNAASETSDIKTVYQLETAMFKEEIPFQLILSLGYKSMKRLFPADDPLSRVSSGFGSVFVGAGTVVMIGKKMELEILLDSGLYSFPLGGLTYNDLPGYLFELSSSFSYRF